MFLDLRGFTAFAETAEPEEVMSVLREYHAEMGELILEHEGTLERFTGDGMMIFFNDPMPVAESREAGGADGAGDARARAPSSRAMAQARPRARSRHRHRPGLRDDRRDRLRGPLGLRRDRHRHQPGRAALRRGAGRPDPDHVARPGARSTELVEAESLGELALKGFSRPVPTFNVVQFRSAAATLL